MLMLDIAGTSLTADDCHLLRQPEIAGVILFARNIGAPHQVLELTKAIRKINSNLIIGIDQEGGRVTRLKQGFSPIPAMGTINALQDFTKYGYLLGFEVQMVGIDFSFTPVLDVDYGISTVIGNRALSKTAEEVTKNAHALLDGLALAGMKGVGKHFPGHGFAKEDSHEAVAEDNRSLEQLLVTDLLPFIHLKNRLAAIMPAHVIYPQLDKLPAGFSHLWLQEILRTKIGFEGLIISDDLCMQAAVSLGDIQIRTKTAIEAGCNIILVCNNRTEAENSLIKLQKMKINPLTNLKTKFKT